MKKTYSLSCLGMDSKAVLLALVSIALITFTANAQLLPSQPHGPTHQAPPPQYSLIPNPQLLHQSGNLSQGGNGPLNVPSTTTGTYSPQQWINGNSNQAKAHYIEGYSIAYQLILDGLTSGSHTVDIEWDIRHSSTNAIDFITTIPQNPA